jgi:penicillin amidase
MKNAFLRRTISAILLATSLTISVISRPEVRVAQPPVPETQEPQTLTLAGLKDRVTVRRDERGIPYIEAGNEADLYFAQGYVTASDRLWQMDLFRRTVRGELSEIFGNAALSQDKLHRTFGFVHVVEESVTHLPPNVRAVLEAYANGVNAFIDSRTAQTMPPEFQLLQYKPRPWTPADSLTLGKLLSEYLSTTWQLDLMRASMASLPKEKREALLPETSPLDVIVVGSDRTPAKRTAVTVPDWVRPDRRVMDQLSELMQSERRSLAWLGFPDTTENILQASNNWVVSGKHTASGKPLLANDPHIPAAAPGIWYQTELSAPGLHVAGVTFPGAPGITIGHNDRIAWGVTNLGPDVQDVYAEKFDKDNPGRYLTPSGWRDVVIRHEQIKVRKVPTDPATETQTFDVTVTRHGPIVVEKDSVKYALQWTALNPATNELEGFFQAARARNWKEFTDALSHYSGPTQNFVYADVDGHIGYYGAGRIPIRKTGDGSLPYDGSTDDGEWTGFIPFDKLPHVFDPPSGMIVTANQRIVGTDYPYFLSHVWAQPYRARRITDLLSEKPKLTTDDFRRIQGDVYSIAGVTFAHAVVKTLKADPAAAADDKLRSTIADLEQWDGRLSVDSRAALVATQMRNAFSQRIITAALGQNIVYRWPESDNLIDRVATDQPKDWLPKEFTSYADLLRACYGDARQALTKAIGADESQWIWGNITKARFPHPLAQVPLIGLRFTVAPFPQNGAGGTVNVGAAVSMRFIADTSNWDHSLNGIPLGESGLPGDSHWKDQLDDWRNVTPRTLPFSRGAIEMATKSVLILEPQAK